MSKLTPVEKRKARIRKKVSGTTVRPRMSVYKSLKYIYAQVIDDSTGRTIAFASSLSKELKGKDEGGKREDAKRVGKLIAEKCKAAKIERVEIDRKSYTITAYHESGHAIIGEAGLAL